VDSQPLAHDHIKALNAVVETALTGCEQVIDLYYDLLIYGATARRMAWKIAFGLVTPVYSAIDEADALTSTAAQKSPDSPRRTQ
jgi:hypothetical protein